MTRLTPSDQAGTGSAPGSATIPPQRSPRSLRLLVLGTGDSAATLRTRAADAGAELAQRFSSRVTHVVVDETVGDNDSRVTRARTAGLPVLSLEQGEELLGAPEEVEVDVVGEVEVDGEAAVSGVGVIEAVDVEVMDVGVEEVWEEKEEGVAAEPEGGEAEPVALGAEPVVVGGVEPVVVGVEESEAGEEGGVEAEEAGETESIAFVRPRSEYAESQEGGPTDVFAGSALEAVLLFPPLPAEESADACGCGEICGGEGGDGGRLEAGVEVEVEVGVGDGVVGEGARAGTGAGAGVGTGVGVGLGAAVEVIGMRLAVEQEDDFGAGVDVAGVTAGDVVLEPDAPVADGAESGQAQTPVAAAGSIAWALVPLASLGLLTPVSMGYAAYRLRSRPLAYATACYTIAVTAAFAVSAAAPRGGATHSVVSDLLTACLATSWLGGTVHSLLIRRRVFG